MILYLVVEKMVLEFKMVNRKCAAKLLSGKRKVNKEEKKSILWRELWWGRNGEGRRRRRRNGWEGMEKGLAST